MNSIKYKDLITELLLQDERLWNEGKTEFNQVLLFDLLDKVDEKIIDLLLQNEEIRNKFFIKIKDVYVFKSNDFKFFMEENKINNSYTAFENIIGLSDGDRFIKNRDEVVINFPFKDCVLEGGQSTEEGEDQYYEYTEEKTKTVNGEKVVEPAGFKRKNSKRSEIFFNEVLANDELDRLRDEKAFVNWKRYTRNSEETIGQIKRNSEGLINENIIIKGNNLLALYSLESQFSNSIKMVYIDPPYYFTKKSKNNDSFVYNTNFKLSTWLTFMLNRLDVAHRLLRNDGVIFVSIDDGGQAYLKVLMDELFGSENFISTLPTIMNLKGNNDEFGFAGTHEYTLVYAKDKNSAVINEFPIDEEELLKKWDKDEIGYYKKGANLKATGVNAPRKKRPNLYYPIFITSEDEIYVTDDDKPLNPKDKVLLPITDGKEMSWRWEKKKVRNETFNIIVSENNGDYSIYKKQRPQLDEIPTKKPKSIFYKPEYSSGNGTRQIKDYFGEKVFNNPKPLELIRDFILLATNENDIILDFHAGSGTTGDATVRLGENRKFILIEQMDYVKDVTVERVRKALESENSDDSFIYFELAEFNEKAKREILQCKNLQELEKLFEELYEHYFLNYNVKVEEFKNNVMKDKRFIELSLEEQQNMFLAMLDLNQMYVNKSEMEDKRYGINDEEQELIKRFYEGV
jgi:adenine-specific DNA-methyltransferase